METEKSFIGAKIIRATPMDEVTFLEQVKGESVSEGRETREGYKVLYPGGYESWSPKGVFENAYREIGDLERLLIK